MADESLHLKLDRLLAGQAEQREAVTSLELVVSTLLQGLQAMLTTQGTHTEMLTRLLRAAGDEAAEDGELVALIRRIETVLTQQTSDLSAIRTTLQRLPGEVEAAAIDGVRMAVGEAVDVRAEQNAT